MRVITASYLRGLLAAGMCLALPNPSVAATVTLTAVADTALFQNDPSHNLGGMTFMPIGRTGFGDRARGLVRFDVAGALPADVGILSAALNLRIVFNGVDREFNYEAHRVLRHWGEGNNTGGGGGWGFLGAPADAGEASWSHRVAPATPWSEPGGAAVWDYAAAPSASAPMNGEGRHTLQSTALSSDVQAWLETPTTNFGWMILLATEDATSGSARRFGTREGGTGATLTINFTERPRIEAVEHVDNSVRFQFQAAIGLTYSVQRRDALDSGSWITMTNFPVLAIPATFRFSDSTASGRRFYRVSCR